MDKYEIISAIENCVGNGPCPKCPFNSTAPGFTNFPDCMVSLQKEALQLIRELTEPTIFEEFLEDGEPRKEEIYDTVYQCKKCGANVVGVASYCEGCGKKIGAVLRTEKMCEVEVM